MFNFDVPSHAEDYVHRIGRTGRAGRKGTAVMICIPRDEKNLADVEALVKEDIPRLDNPMAMAPAAPEAKTEEKPKRSRGRNRKKADAPEAAAQPEPQEQKAPEKRDRKRGQRREAPNTIVGLGDEPPAFIAKSFAERAMQDA